MSLLLRKCNVSVGDMYHIFEGYGVKIGTVSNVTSPAIADRDLELVVKGRINCLIRHERANVEAAELLWGLDRLLGALVARQEQLQFRSGNEQNSF